MLVTHQVCNSMLLSIPVPWPSRVRDLFRSQTILGGAAHAFYAFDCRLTMRTYSPFYDRLVVFALSIPILAVLVPFGVAYLVVRIVRSPSSRRSPGSLCTEAKAIAAARHHLAGASKSLFLSLASSSLRPLLTRRLLVWLR